MSLYCTRYASERSLRKYLSKPLGNQYVQNHSAVAVPSSPSCLLMPDDRSSSNFRRRLILWLSFFATLYITYRLLLDSAMGVQDMLAKLKASKQEVIGGSTGGSQRQPPPIPHGTRPKPGKPAGRPFVVLRDGLLALDDGTPFRFASLNAPELLDGHPFEVEDTMRTLAGFGRRVTRTYTLKIKGTSPHFGDAGHINGWDHQKGDWIYDEGPFKKVKL